jgi:glycosyltransferase involved in cell wall biosynthesis
LIVKNEAKIIRRCLESALPLVDYILAVDTGSTDGTQQLVRDFLAEHKIDGAVLEEAWRDFAYNRNYSLARLREVQWIDYALVIDADDRLELEPGFDAQGFKKSLDRDFYDVLIRHRTITHHRPQLLSNRLPFCFKGVLHEYIEVPPIALTRGIGTGLIIHASTDGARSQDRQKYEKDAATLEDALQTESDPFLVSRYTFYLAQSYRDCANRERAIDNYFRRAELGYWTEEIYVSLYEAAKLMAVLNRPAHQVIATFERAQQIVPGRAEALHGAARYCRNIKDFNQGYALAKEGLAIPKPAGGLFIETWIYDYGLLDEFAVNAYWIGRADDCLHACERLLSEKKMPQDMVARVEANAQFARQQIKPAATSTAVSFGSTPDTSSARQPRVLLAILAKQKERVLPFYLTCIDALDYPKGQIVLHVRTNNNSDATTEILQNWLRRVGDQYAKVEFGSSNVIDRVEEFGVHEWNSTRFKVLAKIRTESMQSALRNRCDFYFVIDTDNFIQPHTLKSLVDLGLPIVAPLLRHENQTHRYSNFHERVDERGYFVDSEPYDWLLYQRVKGLCQVPVVHCTYLVRSDVIPRLSYSDNTNRHEYVIFSESARRHNVPQYLDNRDVYGCLTMDETPETSVRLIGSKVSRAARKADIRATRAAAARRSVEHELAPIFIHSSWRTCSTWFWSKFRQMPSTLALFEPFNQFLNTITTDEALAFSHAIWGSRHPPTEPYCYEYLPLIRRSGGVRLFKDSFPFDWFIPNGGLWGKLRREETKYIALLLREAQLRGRVPVLGFCRSLGRLAAIKGTFGGLNIFLLRNLWRHWISYVALREAGDGFFYDTVPLLANRQDDPFLAYLAGYYLERVAPLADKACLPQVIGAPRGQELLSALPKTDMFGMFAGLHIYLYLHARMSADVTVDATRVARDKKYRSTIEDELRQRTHLPVSFGDSIDQGARSDHKWDQVDWDAIREHADKAIHSLRPSGDSKVLARWAKSWINDAFVESKMEQRAAATSYQRSA